MSDNKRPEYETWPKRPIRPEVQAELDRAAKFIEAFKAGRVERGVNAIAVLGEHAKPMPRRVVLDERDAGSECYCPSASERIGDGDAKTLCHIAGCIALQLPEENYQSLLRLLSAVDKERAGIHAAIEASREQIAQGEPGVDLGSFLQYADDDLDEPPPIGGDLSAHIKLSPEAAERLAEAMADESGPTPAMLALYEKYGKKPEEKRLIQAVVTALKDLPNVASIRAHRVPPKPASMKFYIVSAFHDIHADRIVVGRLGDLERKVGCYIDYDLVPGKSVGMIPPSDEVYRSDKQPSESTVAALEELATGQSKRFNTVEELMADLDKDDES